MPLKNKKNKRKNTKSTIYFTVKRRANAQYFKTIESTISCSF